MHNFVKLHKLSRGYWLVCAILISTTAWAAAPNNTTSGTIGEGDGKKLTFASFFSQCANPPSSSCKCDASTNYVWVCSSGSSIVDNIFANHHHIASDYSVGKVGKEGCAPCGALPSSNGDSSLIELMIERRHRYRESSRGGSFGAGVFVNYDSRLTLYRRDGSHVIDFFDPTEF